MAQLSLGLITFQSNRFDVSKVSDYYSLRAALSDSTWMGRGFVNDPRLTQLYPSAKQSSKILVIGDNVLTERNYVRKMK